MGEIDGERLEEEHLSSPPLLLTAPVHPPDVLRCSPGVFGEGREVEVEMTKGCPEGGADSGLSVSFMCRSDGVELEKISEKYKSV